jgi:hypothetical protein
MECKSLKESEYICMMNTVEITTVDPGLWKRQHGLKIDNHLQNNVLFLETIDYWENNGITLRSKLLFLREFLKSVDQRVSKYFGPPYGKTFLEYLDICRPNNRIACIMGQ